MTSGADAFQGRSGKPGASGCSTGEKHVSGAVAQIMLRLYKGLSTLGYGPERIINDYEFSDVGTPGAETRKVQMAAFTHSRMEIRPKRR